MWGSGGREKNQRKMVSPRTRPEPWNPGALGRSVRSFSGCLQLQLRVKGLVECLALVLWTFSKRTSQELCCLETDRDLGKERER